MTRLTDRFKRYVGWSKQEMVDMVMLMWAAWAGGKGWKRRWNGLEAKLEKMSHASLVWTLARFMEKVRM
jgi:hypothetical protein